MKTQETNIEVIYTFKSNDRAQQIMQLYFKGQPSEAQFLHKALNMLYEAERQDLRKISACHYTNPGEDPVKWIMETNGKYFFN